MPPNSPLTTEEKAKISGYKKGFIPEVSGHSFLQNPLGAALLAWNSKLGVPRDVWAIISTSAVECEKCSLVRPYSEHQAHEVFCSAADWEHAQCAIRRVMYD